MQLDSIPIARVTSTKSLGVFIDEKLDWSIHINDLCNSFRKFIGIFYKISFFLPNNILRMLYFFLVYPKILYVIEIYANTYLTFLHDLIILNDRILRILQKSNRYIHSTELYILYNTLPIDKLHQLTLLQHEHALINNSPRLPSLFRNNITFNNQVHSHIIREVDQISIEPDWVFIQMLVIYQL